MISSNYFLIYDMDCDSPVPSKSHPSCLVRSDSQTTESACSRQPDSDHIAHFFTNMICNIAKENKKIIYVVQTAGNIYPKVEYQMLFVETGLT